MLGERLKQARLALNLSRLAVYKATGISSTTIQRYEECKREPKSGHLRKLARYYGRTMEWLWGDVDDPSTGGTQDTEGLTLSSVREQPGGYPEGTTGAPELSAFLEIVSALTPENRRALRPAVQRLLENQQEIDESRMAEG